MRKMIGWTSAVLALVLVAAFSSRAMAEDTQSLSGKPAPDFSLTTVDGKDVKLSSEKGHVVVVDFWATWCPPCRASLPHIQKISDDKDFKDKGLVVWAVNAREDKGKIDPFMKAQKFSFTVPMDKTGGTLQAYLVQGIPTTVVVGRDGVVKKVFVGFGGDSAKQIDEAVKKALDEKAG